MIYSIQIARLSDVIFQTGLSKTTIWSRVRDGKFVPQIKLSGRASGYIQSEVDAVLTAMAGGLSDDDIRTLVSKLIELRKQNANQLFTDLAA
jgi:prophage regulatory protein